MSLAVRFLGTSASRPTVERNVSSLAVIREGETLMFDCGEGTQRQMMRYGISFTLCDIFFTHMHADHVLGIAGLLRTLALEGRADPMKLYGPEGSASLIRRAVALGSDRQAFPIEVIELAAGTPLKRKGYSIVPFAVAHGDKIALGYQIAEETRLGRFNPERAKELGVECKGLDTGLVDFPGEMDGRPIYYCWKLGEPSVQFWHGVNAGFAGRQPLRHELAES